MKIYTDGATSNNGYKGSRGGWAWVIVDNNNKIVTQGYGAGREVTNNQCELMALIEACQEAKKDDNYYTIYSDSAYIINCYQQKWYKKWQQNGWINSKKDPVANQDLWEMLIPYFENPKFEFIKVKGHSTDYWNNYVDRMAVNARLFVNG